MKQSAILLIDLQNDFCAGGALAVPDGDSTIAIANRLTSWGKAHGMAILASQDWHPAEHGSFASNQGVEPWQQGILNGLPQTWWPDHCIQNTSGADLHPLLHQQVIDALFYKGEDPKTDSYSAFFDNGHQHKTQLDNWLQHHDITTLVVMGLATDYCVKFSVLDALQLGYQVCVITDGCRSVNLQPNDSAHAFEQMAAAGATLYTLNDWLEEQH